MDYWIFYLDYLDCYYWIYSKIYLIYLSNLFIYLSIYLFIYLIVIIFVVIKFFDILMLQFYLTKYLVKLSRKTFISEIFVIYRERYCGITTGIAIFSLSF